MTYILTALAFLVIGFVIGGLTFRKNANRINTTVDSGKKLLDALKGR
jgi:hypothetical protein